LIGRDTKGLIVEALQFRLLGPVTTVVGGRAHSLPRAQTRGLFAYLLLHAGRPVPTAALIDAMWGGAEPSTARSQISAAVGTIRRELARLGVPEAIDHVDEETTLAAIRPHLETDP
jgi:two-component SAPR family response regulator